MKILGITERGYASGGKSFICEVSELELRKVMDKAGYRDKDDEISKIRVDMDFPIAEGYDFRHAIAASTQTMQNAFDQFQKVAPVMAKFAGLVAQAEATTQGASA